MKKLLLCLSVCSVVMFSAHAEQPVPEVSVEDTHRAFWVSGGKGDEPSAAIGVREKNVGFEFGGLANSDWADTDILDYPVPHNSYTNLGEQNVGNTLGLDVLGFYNVHERVALYAGLGGYFSDKAVIARSNATGLYYTQSDESGFEAAASAGVQFKLGNRFLLGAGYHSIRGVNLQLGMTF